MKNGTAKAIGITGGVVLGMIAIVLVAFFHQASVNVEYYGKTPAALEDGLGNKVFKPTDLPEKEYTRVFGYTMRCEEASGFDSEAYKKMFPNDVVKKTENSGSSSAIILSDYRPNWEECLKMVEGPEEGFRAWQECKARAEWLRE